MVPEMSASTYLISLIIFYVLTNSYCWRVVQTSPCQPLSRRRPVSPERRLCPQSFADIFCAPAAPNVLDGKTSPKEMFLSSPSQTQQRWAERPVSTAVLSRIFPASYPSFFPPPLPSHRSAHRYCAWKPPIFPWSSPSLFFLPADVEAIQLFNSFVEAERVESLALRGMRSIHPHPEAQGQRQGEHSVSSRDFSAGRAGLIDRQEGGGVRNPVKALDRDRIPDAGLQADFLSSATHDGFIHFLTKNTKGSINVGWPDFHSLSSVPPVGAAIHLSSLWRLMPSGR